MAKPLQFQILERARALIADEQHWCRGLLAIVRVDPKTKEVNTWPLPASRAGANLNTAAFDGKGRIWFTGQTGIYGRLDPTT